MQLDKVLLGSLLAIPTWMILHRSLFPGRFGKGAGPLRFVLCAAFLIAAQAAYQYYLDFLPSPLLVVMTYFALFSAALQERGLTLLAEAALSYSFSVVLGAAAAALASMICLFILQSSSMYLIYFLKAVLQTAMLLILTRFCRNRRLDLSPVLDGYSGPLIAVYSSYFISSYAVVRLLNLKDSPALGAAILLNILHSSAFVLFWAKDKLAQRRQNAKAACELSNTLIANDLLTESLHAQETLLHRYRKLVPGAGISIGLLLDHLSRHPSDPAAKQELQTLARQYAEMQREMGIDAQMEIIRGMGYGSCGHLITDGMLYGLMAEAARRSIHVLFHPQAPLTVLEGTVSLSRAGNAVSDLLSNAIYWAGAGKAPVGRVLLHMQMAEGVFVVSVYDNGPAFPLSVLSQIGRRGVTTREDGSGNGLPDVLEMLLSCGGSLDIVELPPEDLYTKAVRLRFDGEGLFSVDSSRAGAQRCLTIREQISSCTDKIEI